MGRSSCHLLILRQTGECHQSIIHQSITFICYLIRHLSNMTISHKFIISFTFHVQCLHLVDVYFYTRLLYSCPCFFPQTIFKGCVDSWWFAGSLHCLFMLCFTEDGYCKYKTVCHCRRHILPLHRVVQPKLHYMSLETCHSLAPVQCSPPHAGSLKCCAL